MTRKNAVASFNYWGNNIVTPTGKTNLRAEKMRSLWAKAIDDGSYRSLPNNDACAADAIIEAVVRDKEQA